MAVDQQPLRSLAASTLSRRDLAALAAPLALGWLAPAIGQAQSAPTAPDPAELRRKLAERLTGATLEGVFFATKTPAGQDPVALGQPRAERYEIEVAQHDDGDWWTIVARLRFEEIDVKLPVRLRIAWADQTPVMIVDDFKLPGGGVYGARVLIHESFYGGVWTGGEFSGTLSGRIYRTPADPAGSTSKER